MNALETELNERDSALKTREEEISKREASVTEQEKKISEASEKLNAHESEIAKREKEITAREEALANKNKQLEEATASFTSREAALVNREANATRKAAEVQDMETLIKELPAFNPNTSTEAAMILTYPLPAERRRELIAMQRAAYQKYSAKRITQAFEDYVKAAEAEPNTNYLAAYWAALSAERLRNRHDDALTWVNKALEINTDYKPAQELKQRLEAPARRRAR